MQNIQSKLRNIGIAVLVVIIAADALGYGVPVVEAVKDTVVADATLEGQTEEQTEAETQTENIVQNVIAEIESDEVHLVMGSNNQEKPSETEVETEAPKPVISYTEADYNNLLKIVEAEATGCDMIGKILVANVIINRVKDRRFADNITSVIYAGRGEQFTPIKDGRFYSVTVTQSTIEAVDRALLGEDYSQGALYFAATWAVTPDSWHSTHLKRLFEYGGHVFFNYY